MSREEIIAVLAALREEMSLVRPKPPAPATQPPMVQFSKEELERAAADNVWVRMNVAIPQTPVRRRK